MPLAVFDIKGVPYTHRERIEQAVIAGGKHLREPYEGWIATDPVGGGVRVTITGANGFQRDRIFQYKMIMKLNLFPMQDDHENGMTGGRFAAGCKYACRT
jgi:hypothetical protein